MTRPTIPTLETRNACIFEDTRRPSTWSIHLTGRIFRSSFSCLTFSFNTIRPKSPCFPLSLGEIRYLLRALGSPSFMPPEQAGSRDKVSRRSDVYGLGGTRYYALTGRAPFQGETPAKAMHEVLTQEPEALRSLDPSIPRYLETICLKCPEKEPSRRYAGARMVAEAPGRFLDGRPILARPVRMREKIWRWCRRSQPIRFDPPPISEPAFGFHPQPTIQLSDIMFRQPAS